MIHHSFLVIMFWFTIECAATTALTKIIKWSIVSFYLAPFGYFTYLLSNGKDSDDPKISSIIAFYFINLLRRMFTSESLARFLREREIINSVWTEKVRQIG